MLDTNAFIGMMHETAESLAVLPRVASLSISVITLGELHAGAANSTRRVENARALEKALYVTDVLLVDHETAYHYGQLFAQACAQAHFPPQNDLWIAAIAIQHRLPLVTRDKHFDRFAGLELVTW